jgi:LPXTG-site transpeptidase (sortase) family protein
VAAGTVRTRPDRQPKRGKGPARALAVLGSLLVALAVTLVVLDHSEGEDARGRTASAGRRFADPDSRVLPRKPVAATAREAAPALRRLGAAGRPVRLEVPALDVAAPVTAIGLEGRALVPPADPTVLGWWRGGAVPGAARGTSVITGHTVHTGGGVFDDLADLRPGDRVRVTTTNGALVYRVSSVTTYRKATLAAHAAEIFSQGVPGRLELITCEDWNGRAYESNTVATATPLPAQ